MTRDVVRRARQQARVRRQQLLAERRATDPRRLDRSADEPADESAREPGSVSGGRGRAGSPG